jgi:hypothetical protein
MGIPAIRGAEQQLQVIVDGKTMEGSYLKVNKFTHTPLVTEITRNYIGEPYDTNDQMLHGQHLVWDNDQLDSTMLAFLLDVQARADGHLPPADVAVIVKEAYRDGATTSDVLFSGNGVLTPTTRGGAGQKDTVSGSWSFKCQKIALIA